MTYHSNIIHTVQSFQQQHHDTHTREECRPTKLQMKIKEPKLRKIQGIIKCSDPHLNR